MKVPCIFAIFYAILQLHTITSHNEQDFDVNDRTSSAQWSNLYRLLSSDKTLITCLDEGNPLQNCVFAKFIRMSQKRKSFRPSNEEILDSQCIPPNCDREDEGKRPRLRSTTKNFYSGW